jgi:hypothetical protein
MTGPSDSKSSSLIERLNKRRAQVAAEARGEQIEQDKPVIPQNEGVTPDALDPESAVEGDGEDEEAELSDAALLEKYELPDPETVEDEAGLNKFFEGDMPDRLRQMAMRRVWRLNPLFRFADEMVEYGEDYTDAATVIEGMQTAYQVGKGYLQKAKEALDTELGDADLIEGGGDAKKGGTEIADKKTEDKDNNEKSEAAQNDEQSEANADNNDANINANNDGTKDGEAAGAADKGETGNVGNGELSHSDENAKNAVAPELAQENLEEDIVIQEVRPRRMVFSRPK